MRGKALALAQGHLSGRVLKEVASFARAQRATGQVIPSGELMMSIRTYQSTVTFARPFRLEGFDEHQPAGDYRVDIDEELIEGLSFLAYRRVAALVYLPAISEPQTHVKVALVAPAELDAMRLRDRELAEPPVPKPRRTTT